MIRRRGFIGSILGGTGACFLGVKRSTAEAGALKPPRLAMSAGFSNLIFDEEFDRTPNIGFCTDGHEWNGGYPNSVWCTLHKTVLETVAGPSELSRAVGEPRLTDYSDFATFLLSDEIYRVIGRRQRSSWRCQQTLFH